MKSIFFKRMNNSVFGKILKSIRNRVDARLISSNKVAQKLAAKENYDRCTIFDENLIAVHMKKTKLYFDKTLENIRNRVDIRIISTDKVVQKQ